MPPREIDGLRSVGLRRVRVSGRRSVQAPAPRATSPRQGSGRLVPGTGERSAIGVEQPIERTPAVHRGLVQHARALGIVLAAPGVHQ